MVRVGVVGDVEDAERRFGPRGVVGLGIGDRRVFRRVGLAVAGKDVEGVLLAEIDGDLGLVARPSACPGRPCRATTRAGPRTIRRGRRPDRLCGVRSTRVCSGSKASAGDLRVRSRRAITGSVSPVFTSVAAAGGWPRVDHQVRRDRGLVLVPHRPDVIEPVVADEMAHDDLAVGHVPGNVLDPHLVERLGDERERVEHAEIDDRPLAELARARGDGAVLPQRDVLAGRVVGRVLFQGEAPVVRQRPEAHRRAAPSGPRRASGCGPCARRPSRRSRSALKSARRRAAWKCGGRSAGR